MLCIFTEQQHSIAVLFPYSMLTKETFPDTSVLTDSCVEVIHDDELVLCWYAKGQYVQFLIETFFDLLVIDDSERIRAYYCQETLAGQWNPDMYQSIADSFR